MIDQIKIGRFLRDLRKEKELTQEQLRRDLSRGFSTKEYSLQNIQKSGSDSIFSWHSPCFLPV